jgi:hypothetical protein
MKKARLLHNCQDAENLCRLPSGIRACIAIGASVAAGLGTMAAVGGNSVRSEPTIRSAPAGYTTAAKGLERSGTLVTYILVY